MKNNNCMENNDCFHFPQWAFDILRDPLSPHGEGGILKMDKDMLRSNVGNNYIIKESIPVFCRSSGSYMDKTIWPEVDQCNGTIKSIEGIESIFDRMSGVLHDRIIVDMCSGGAMPGSYLASRYNCRVISVERAFGAIKYYGDKFMKYYNLSGGQVIRVCADALNLPLADESVDVVAGSSWVHHFEDKVAILKEAYRVLKPGGYLIAHNEKIKGVLSPEGSAGEDIYVSRKEYRLAAQKAGFGNVRVIGFSRFFWLLGTLKLRGSVDIVGEKPKLP